MKLEDIKNAVANLSQREFASFHVWFEIFDAARFDEKIESDAVNGKLDRLANEALADLRKRTSS